MIMPTDPTITGISHVIQLAVAPVFLLTGVGALLSVMTNRLARVIDRARVLEARFAEFDLAKRAHLASWAINFCTVAALLVCSVVATLFIDAFLGTNLKWLVGTLFVTAMVALIGGLVSFLREVYCATHTMRIGPPQ
jgi:hypothetical protein